MAVLQIDVDVQDGDGNVASDSVAVDVEAAAPAARSELASAQPQAQHVMASVGGLGNESVNRPPKRNDNLYTPPVVTQASRSQTMLKFTGGYR